MSGICGICEPGRSITASQLVPMVESMSTGGNARDVLTGDSTGLAVIQHWDFQQLSSVPGIRVAADADICNLAEIRAELTHKGVAGDLLSPAEIVSWLYKLEGLDFVNKLGGGFSFALWDENERRLVLGIDRLGIKGLYWSKCGGRLLFASRLDAIRACQEVSSEPDPSAIMQFLLFSVIPAPLTAYRGVEKLRPGFLLILEDGHVRHHQYWDLEYRESNDRDAQHWAEATRDALRSAVHRTLQGLVSTHSGAYLSGGTDSSSVVAFMDEQQSPVNTFSIFFAESVYSEISFARTTARHFRTRHYEKCLTAQDALEAIPKIIDFYDEPFGNSSAIGAYHCARLAKESGVDTLLAGDGGDELFAGNARYASDKQFSIYHSIPSWIRRGILEPVLKFLPSESRWLGLPRRYVRRANLPNPRRMMSYNLFLSGNPREVLNSEFLIEVPEQQWLAIVERHFHQATAESELNRLLHLDIKLTLADNDLRKVNGTAELAGVRVRYPLLDHRLCEFSGLIPSSLKLKGFKKRYIFKQAMRGILPDEILYKKKHGFGVPLGAWFLQDPRLSSLVKDVLGDRRTRQRGYFRREFLDQLSGTRLREQPSYYGEILWYVVVLELWARQHMEKVGGAPVERQSTSKR